VARNRKRAKERRARRPNGAGVGPRARYGSMNSEGAPDPIEHAAPDAELADAQLALGRPELTDGQDLAGEAEAEELETEAEDNGGPVATVSVAQPRQGIVARLVGFLQGSWRELQRVQWPDRRQVVQATSVVIGFVIVAGVFLGVADLLAGHLMTFILNGHW
jgi:preprotein translocase SecE subunit